MALHSTNGTHAVPTSSATSFVSLAANISEKAASLSAYLESQGHAQPNFIPGCADPPETEEYLALHTSLTSSLEDLQRLADGPRRSLRPFIMIGNDLAALQVAFDFGFFQLVPFEGSIDVETLARKVGIDADRVARVLRMLATHRIFVEPKPGFFAHTAASAVFHDDEELRCAGHYMYVYAAYLQCWIDSGCPNNTLGSMNALKLQRRHRHASKHRPTTLIAYTLPSTPTSVCPCSRTTRKTLNLLRVSQRQWRGLLEVCCFSESTLVGQWLSL